MPLGGLVAGLVTQLRGQARLCCGCAVSSRRGSGCLKNPVGRSWCLPSCAFTASSQRPSSCADSGRDTCCAACPCCHMWASLQVSKHPSRNFVPCDGLYPCHASLPDPRRLHGLAHFPCWPSSIWAQHPHRPTGFPAQRQLCMPEVFPGSILPIGQITHTAHCPAGLLPA